MRLAEAGNGICARESKKSFARASPIMPGRSRRAVIARARPEHQAKNLIEAAACAYSSKQDRNGASLTSSPHGDFHCRRATFRPKQ